MVNTFEGLLALLVAKEVRFALVGGLAVSLNGFVRTTEDMDILVDDHPSNLQNLLNCLAEFGEGYARELAPADFVDEEGAIRIREDFDLDVFVRMSGRKYQDLTADIQFHETTDGTRVPYLSAAGLIRLKENSHREKDLLDVAALKRTAAEMDKLRRIPSLDSLRSVSGESPENP
jgi:hypothetical protein